ncbi:hypothetical protein CTI12_AA424620 [Artemisia annua]|uniref:TOD1/MUCI70 glycosyltransferase-like domain-containing protein n=1 Tax=Artemisia annua TaxID=35608 RepID=A0A2U1M3J8_ARTAN|nr:hypothetical protein CTI12_AA424620 [Artemisia annua]
MCVQIPKLLLHRLFPNVRYSLWVDGKLELVVDPYQILERLHANSHTDLTRYCKNGLIQTYISSIRSLIKQVMIPQESPHFLD